MKRLRQLAKYGDLDQPDRIRAVICAFPVSEGRKQLLADAYDAYARYMGYSWSKPKFRRVDQPIFLPSEQELNMLIAHTYYKLSVFLQLLKETGMESGEAWLLTWQDIDVERKTVAVHPTKNHDARVLPISDNLLSRLLKLPRKNERVFACRNLDRFRWRYERARNMLAEKLNNPRLRQISFRSFRHWKATTLYAQTKDILLVKHVLGHRRIENTLIYTHLVNFGSEEYVCRAATTVDEAKALIEAGYEYVTDMDGFKLFRKRK